MIKSWRVVITKAVPLLFAVFWSGTAEGTIVVTPASPSSGDTVTIRLENSFGAEARATSASIAQTGNTFTIQQNVEIACVLPSNPTVSSEFQVGPLAPGNYTVTANITFTGVPPLPCSPAPITQTSSFTVAAPIPALDSVVLVVLAAMLGVVALVSLKR